MSIRSILRVIALTLAFCAFACALSTCGRSQRNGVIPAGKFTRLNGGPADTQELSEVMAEIDAYSCPEGVDEELWVELKDALGEALEKRAFSVGAIHELPSGNKAGRGDPALHGKFVSTPPTGEANRVNDLAITDNGDGTFTLTWHYRNLGDYDQSGTVGISDITPIAMHYGETYDIEDENCLLAVIDGSGNGEIDIADITPLAMCYATDCAGYVIQGGNSPTGLFPFDKHVSVETATGEGRLSFSEGLISIIYLYLRVTPFDTIDAPREYGEPSEPVLVPGDPPEITSVTPLTGLEDEVVAFSADVSSTPPLTYAWDFGSGADPNSSSLSNPSVTLGAVGEYEAQLTVTSVFGEDVFPFMLTVSPAPPEIISVSPTEGTETYEVQFTAEVTGSGPFTYAWDFGGGATPDTSDEAAPTVTLGDVSEYSASLTVINAAGDDTFPFTLTVVAGVPANITSVSPLSGIQGDEVTFTAEISGTPPFDHTWDFKGAVTGADTSSESPSGVWGDASTYEDCNLTVTNTFGNDTYLFALTVTSTGWHIKTVDSAGSVGEYTSLAIVNGNPAISYYDRTNDDLKYVRADDASGTSWGPPLIMDSAGRVGFFTSLVVVNGNPAISYSAEWPNNELKYVRATDASGSSWGAPVTVLSEGNGFDFISLAVVNGNPAISYFDWLYVDLMYVRATNASGSSWGTPVSVDSAGFAGLYTSLAVVNGNPAISYCDYDDTDGLKDLKYVRASDTSGSSWGTPLILDSEGGHTSLAVISGNPAISYKDTTNLDLKYVRASDASGGSWGTPVTVDNVGDVGHYASLAVVNGNPAISYLGGGLKYVRASDASGGSWGTPVNVDSVGSVGWYTSLAVVDGNPAISYFSESSGDLKFAIYY